MSAVAPADDELPEDVPDTPSEPLRDLPLPADPANAIDVLPSQLGDLPVDDSGSATVDETWTDVPGLPVEIQIGDDPGEATPGEPSEPSEAASPSEEPSPTETPTDTPQPSESPEEEPEPATPEAEGGSQAPPAGEELVVSLVTPDDLPQGVLLMSVEFAEDETTPEQEPGSEPTEQASEAPSADPSELPTDESSASSEPVEPSESASPGTEPTDSPESPTADPSLEPDPESADATGISAEDVDVRLSYGDFEKTFGGAWSDRLQVMAYPACFAETPDLAECSVGVPVLVDNDAVADTLTFTTVADEEIDEAVAEDQAATGEEPGMTDELVGDDEDASASPAAFVTSARTGAASPALPAGSSGAVYSVSAGAGNYGATPFSPSSQWQVGVGSGEFTYSYPFEMPPALAGNAPELALQYSSGSVDAMSLAENGQASPAGLGWDLSISSISRSYASCKDDGLPNKGDLCWKTDNKGLANRYDISLNGRSSQLIRVGLTNMYRMRDDAGWRIELHETDGFVTPGAQEPDNSDNNDETFEVTTPDGTTYWFGWGRGSNSVWTVPVYGNNAGEPCHSSSGVAASWCQQAWRWNLDKIVDPNGNVTKYTYATETNYYARYADTSAGNRTPYDRAGQLAKIEYGFDRANGVARQVVEVDTLSRCTPQLTVSTADCTGPNSVQQAPAKWPDTPGDLICASTGTCTVGSPAFFSTRRYWKVTTKTVQGSPGGLTTRVVDLYGFGHTMPDPDGTGPDDPDLWLNRIVRVGTGEDGTVELPPVFFDGDTALRNRVVASGGERTLKKFRIASVRNETGGRIQVFYGHAPNRTCDAAYVDGRPRNSSQRECFAQKYAPPGGTSHWEWFHKYVVTRIALGDDALGYRLGEAPTQSTKLGQLRVYDYDYIGEPAWRFADSRNLPADEESWTDWRGYETTLVRTRTTQNQALQSGDEAIQRVVRFRGMHGTRSTLDGSGTGFTRRIDTAEIGSGVDEPIDYDWLEGKTAETESLKPGGALIERTYHDYQWYETTDVEGSYRSLHIYNKMTRTTTAVANGSNRVREVSYTVNDGGAEHRGLLLGAVVSVEDRGLAGDSGDNTCATTTWEQNAAVWIRAPKQQALYDSSCSENPAGLTRKSVSLYDNQEDNSNNPLTKGRLTAVRTYTTSANYNETRTSYDAYGRITWQRDGTGAATTTEYNPNGLPNNLLSSVKVTQPTGLVTTVQLDPRRGLPISSREPSGATTTATYDGIGQLLTVRLPGNTETTPSLSYHYDIRAGAPSRTIERAQRNGTTVDTTVSFTDGWGRPIETQTPQPSPDSTTPNARIVSVTGYDDQGLVRFSMPALANPNSSATPWDTVVNPDPANVQRYTITDYDAAGRPVLVTNRSENSTRAVIEMAYLGDRSYTIPAKGGRTTTLFDVRGRTTEVRQYDDAAATALKDSATYGYDAAGELTTMQKTLDSNLETWSYTYDLAGRQVASSDPDTGETSSEYDANGNLTRSVTPTEDVTTAYDWLGRPTLRHATGAPSSKLASWTYGTTGNKTGRLVKSISYTSLGEFATTVDEYDPRGNPLSVSYAYPASLTGEAPTSAAPSGLGGTTHSTKTFTYGYNDGGLTTTATEPVSPFSASEVTITTNYTVGGRLSSMTAPGNLRLVDATYNNLGQTVGLASSDNNHAAYAKLNREYSWDVENGDLIRIRATNNRTSDPLKHLTLDYTYDIVGNPQRITATKELATFNPDGSVAVQNVTPIVAAWCYNYDGLNRLKTALTNLPNTATSTECKNPEATDNTGPSNIVSVTGGRTHLNYEYKNDRLWTVTSAIDAGRQATYTWDEPGPHQTSAITVTGAAEHGLPAPTALQYDNSGRIKTMTPGTGDVSTYKYDDAGQLESITEASGGGTSRTSRFAYDTEGLRVARQVTTGTTTVNTIFVGNTEISATAGVTGSARTIKHYATPAGTPIATNTSVRWFWLLGDAQNNIRYIQAVNDPAGVAYYNYSPFGAPTGAQSTPGNRGYLNKAHDPNGDIRLDHRSYTPGVNVLTAPDPVLLPGDPQSFNPYAYARNNPVAFVDPTGLNAMDPNDLGKEDEGRDLRGAGGQASEGNEGSTGDSGSDSGDQTHSSEELTAIERLYRDIIAQAGPETPLQVGAQTHGTFTGEHVITLADLLSGGRSERSSYLRLRDLGYTGPKARQQAARDLRRLQRAARSLRYASKAAGWLSGALIFADELANEEYSNRRALFNATVIVAGGVGATAVATATCTATAPVCIAAGIGAGISGSGLASWAVHSGVVEFWQQEVFDDAIESNQSDIFIGGVM